MLGLLLGVVAALPFAAAEAAGALVDAGVHPWRARRADAGTNRGPLAEAYLLFALALFAAADGPRLVAVAAGRSYLAWPIGHAPSMAAHRRRRARSSSRRRLRLAAPALAAMVVAELALALSGACSRRWGAPSMPRRCARWPSCSSLRRRSTRGARALVPAMTAAAHLQATP